ncbi:MAG: hypothetical protein Q8906_09705 [Bacillota bacterium]|nr:hypothetical protein [Bacillota bacterium]
MKKTLLIGAEGAKRQGSSPARPRKAKRLERKSTDLFNEVISNNIIKY